MSVLIVIGLLTCVSSGVAYEGAISELVADGSEIGLNIEGPKESDFLLVDDITQTDQNSNGQINQLAQSLAAKISPYGVVSFATLTYPIKNNPVHIITLRIFIFSSTEKAGDWCQKKYQGENWEKYYDAVQDVSYTGYHSKQMNKRIACFDNVWITSGTILEGNEPIKILEYYVSQMQ